MKVGIEYKKPTHGTLLAQCYMCGVFTADIDNNVILHNGTVNHLCGECWKKLERMVSRKGDDMPPVRGKY